MPKSPERFEVLAISHRCAILSHADKLFLGSNTVWLTCAAMTPGFNTRSSRLYLWGPGTMKPGCRSQGNISQRWHRRHSEVNLSCSLGVCTCVWLLCIAHIIYHRFMCCTCVEHYYADDLRHSWLQTLRLHE